MLTISRVLIAATALAAAAQWGQAQARPAVGAAVSEAAAAAAAPVSPAPGAVPVPAPVPVPVAAAPAEAAGAEAAASAHRVPADTGVMLETAQPLSSATAKRGDGFALRLAEPLLVNGAVVLPAGAACHGEVIHAERSRGGGKPGELLLAARYIEYGGRRIALRGFRLSGAGQEKMGAAIGVAVVAGPLAMFVRGGQIEIPAGARAQARLAEALDLSAVPLAPSAPASAPAAGAAIASAAPAPASASHPAPHPAAAPATVAPASISTQHPTTGEAVQ